jgi:hypothetical protein
VLCQGGIHEAFLPLQRFDCAAAWLVVVIKCWIDDFRIQLGDSAQACSGSPVSGVLGLAEHELSA